jgi:predicted nuclease of predicted toxin-antitoxin system
VRFLLDESADFPLAAHLAEQGHDVTSIVHDHPRGINDVEVLAIAQREGRILITNDKDFGELIFRRRLAHSGVILFRLEEEPIEVKKAWLDRVTRDFADLLNEFIVITDNGIRVRRG